MSLITRLKRTDIPVTELQVGDIFSNDNWAEQVTEIIKENDGTYTVHSEQMCGSTYIVSNIESDDTFRVLPREVVLCRKEYPYGYE